MRILHVVPSYIPAWRYGGPIHSVHGLCSALAARGHDVDVATTNIDGSGNSDVPLDVPVDLDGVKVHYFHSPRLRRLYYSPSMYRFITDSIAQWQIIHLHSVFLWPTAAAAHIARRHNTPHVLSPRGMLVRNLILKRSSLVKLAWIRLVERRNVERASAIHITSESERNDLIAMGFKPRHVFNIPNGFDLPHPTGAAESKPGPIVPGKYILFLGRISWKKGIDRLLDAMTYVPHATLVVAGNDDENYWPAMSQKIQKLAISERVSYVGYVEGARKRDLLAGAAVLALPSYSENFGNVVLEAMAMGVPVVVTPEVGLSSTVAKTNSGIVVDGAAEVFGRALSQVLSDDAARKTFGENGRVAAREFSWSHVAGRMEDEYRALTR